MARRRSLNRRWSRRSLNGTGILNDDSNIYDEGDPLWWKQIENNPNSIRPSGRFSLGEASTTTELNPDSAMNETSSSDEWWDVLQKTSQDLVPRKSDKNNSKTSPKKDIVSHTSDSDTDDRTRAAKKRKLNFRRSRKSLGKNAFSQILDSSEPAIESEPTLSQNSHVTRASYQSLDEYSSRKTRQQNENESISSHNSSDTEKIRKKRPLFKKPREVMSRSAFNDVLEADESVIPTSQNVDVNKSNEDSDAISRRPFTRSHSTILKPINEQKSLIENMSLEHSKKSITKSLHRSAKNESLEADSKNEKKQSVQASPVNTNREQNQIPESENESDGIIPQPRAHFKAKTRKKSSTNPFDDILGDSDKEDQELSRQNSTRPLNSSLTSRRNSRSDRSNSLTLHLSSNSDSSLKKKSQKMKQTRRNVSASSVDANNEQNPVSESGGELQNINEEKTTANSDSATKIRNRKSKNVQKRSLASHISPSNSKSASVEAIKQTEKYESDASSTTSISEELKLGNQNQQWTTGKTGSVSPKKMNASSTATITDEIIQDWESEQSDASDSPVRLNSENANISDHSAVTEINDEVRTPIMSDSKAPSQNKDHTKNESINDVSVKNHTKTPQKTTITNISILHNESSNEQNVVYSPRRNTRRTLNYSSESNSTPRGKAQSTEQSERSGKEYIKESKSNEKVNTPRISKQRTRSSKFSVAEVDTNSVNVTVDPSIENSSQKIDTSDEAMTTNKSNKKPSKSMEISEDESNASEERIFNNKTLDKSAPKKDERSVLEENNNKGADSPKKVLSATRKSRASTRKTPDVSQSSLKIHAKTDNKIIEPIDDSESDGEISRDPSSYDLPDMERSDSVILSDSDSEHETHPNENTPGNQILESNKSSETNRSPEKKHSPVKNRSPIKNKNYLSKDSINDISIQPPELTLPSTSGIGKGLSIRRSSINTSKRKSNKTNVSSNQRSILNYLTAHSPPRPVRYEPLPTQEQVNDFNEKLKAVTVGRGAQKELQKKEMEKELEEMRMKMANKASGTRKVQRKIVPRKKAENAKKDIDKAYIVNGTVYKQPKLPRPKHWATDRLYKFLWKMLEPKYKFETRLRSEKFVIDLSNVVTIVMRRHKYQNYQDEVDALMKRMAHLNIIKTRADFYDFCYDFLPYEFRVKVTPILQPGNKVTIPYDPATVNIPIING